MIQPHSLHKLFIAVLIGLLVVTVVLLYLTWSNRLVPITNHQAPQADTPAAKPDTTARTVANTDWRYTIANPAYESKFHLTITVAPDSTGNLLLSGHGCNDMGARVSTSQPESYAKKRLINDTTYYLHEPISTLIACQGEASTYDATVYNELLQIFDSLRTV